MAKPHATPQPAPKPATKAAVETPEPGAKRRLLGLLPPAADRSQEGFIKAIRAAIEDLGGVAFESAGDMEDGLEEHIRRALGGPKLCISVRYVGRRIGNSRARVVITTDWGLREDVEGALSFQLFKPTK